MGKREITFLADQVERVTARLRRVRKLGYRLSATAIAAEVAVGRRPPTEMLRQQRQRIDSERAALEAQTARLYADLLAHEERLQALALLLRENERLMQLPERQPYVDGLLTELTMVAANNQTEASAIVAHWRNLHGELAAALREVRLRLAPP